MLIARMVNDAYNYNTIEVDFVHYFVFKCSSAVSFLKFRIKSSCMIRTDDNI